MQRFKHGVPISWNSEFGRTQGTSSRVITRVIEFEPSFVRASSVEPQFEIRNDSNAHVAMQKGSALMRLRV
jgi:hypothetical protein